MAKHPRSYSGHSPLTANPIRHLDFKIQEIPIDMQISKLKKSAEKTGKQIKALIQKKSRVIGQEQAKIEASILRHEAVWSWKMQRVQMLVRRMKVQDKRDETKKANLTAEMSVHIKNLEKIRPVFNPKSRITPEHQGNIEQVFGKQKPEVKRVGNTVKPVRKKRFALK